MRAVSFGLTTLALALAGNLAAPTPSWALYEVCNPYSLQDFRDQLSAMEKAFEDFDLNEARYQAETAEKNARCINEPVTPGDVARFARDRAQMYFFDSKTDSATEWMLVALAADGSNMPESIGEEHPLRLVLRDVMVDEIEQVSYAGHALPPKKGVVLMNGRLVQQPTGWSTVKGLVQIFDKQGAYVEGFWVTGADWSDDVEETFVSADEGPYKVPSWWKGPKHEQAPNLLAAISTVTGMEIEGVDVSDPVVPDPDPVEPDPDPAVTTGDDGADSGDGLVQVPPPDKVKPPKTPKPPKPPSEGPNTGLLSTGLGVAVLGGALWGVGAALNGSDPTTGYSGEDLAARRTTINALGTGGAGLMAVGVGLFSVSFVSDGASLRLGRRF